MLETAILVVCTVSSLLVAAPHRALEDIRESIEELKYYKATIFK